MLADLLPDICFKKNIIKQYLKKLGACDDIMSRSTRELVEVNEFHRVSVIDGDA